MSHALLLALLAALAFAACSDPRHCADTCLTDDESECYDACFRGHHHRCQQRCGRPETQKCISECHRNCELLQATLTSETQATQEATTAPKKPDEKKGDNVESFLHYSRSQDAKRIHAAISHKKQKHHMSAQLRHELNPSTYGLKDHTDSDDKEFDNDESRKKFQAIMSQYRVEASNPAANSDPSPSPSLPSSSSSQMAASAKDGDEDAEAKFAKLKRAQIAAAMKGRKHPIKEEDIVPSDEGSRKKGADDDDNDEEDSNSDKNEEDEGKGKSSHMASKGDSDDGKDENDKDSGVPQFPKTKVDELLDQDMHLVKNGHPDKKLLKRVFHRSSKKAPTTVPGPTEDPAQAAKDAARLRRQIQAAYMEHPEGHEIDLQKTVTDQKIPNIESETDVPETNATTTRTLPPTKPPVRQIPHCHRKIRILKLRLKNRKRKLHLCENTDAHCLVQQSHVIAKYKQILKLIVPHCKRKHRGSSSQCTRHGYKRWVMRQRALIQLRVSKCIRVDRTCIDRHYQKLQRLRTDGPKLYLTFCPELTFLKRYLESEEAKKHPPTPVPKSASVSSTASTTVLGSAVAWALTIALLSFD